MGIIRPKITAHGYITAVKDYTEGAVVEELVANSYDEDASHVLVLLDQNSETLYVIDNGNGFNSTSINEISTLGGSDKISRPFARGKRIYLGSYGYGLKSTLKIANKFEIISSCPEDNLLYKAEVDWTILKEALQPEFVGYPNSESPRRKGMGKGTIIKLTLKSPASKSQLDLFGKGLSNLPTDNGKFKCYYGLFQDAGRLIQPYFSNFKDLPKIIASLYRQNKINFSSDSFDKELADCSEELINDKEDKTVSAKIYFAGIHGGKVRPLKSTLRGIYVRIHGRLLKHNFSENEYVYNISKYNSLFSHGMRVELSVDWLRNEITLSRDGLNFSNAKLEEDFKTLVQRTISRFIKPKLESIQKGKNKVLDNLLKQRLELAEKRSKNNKGVLIRGISGGFCFKPETDAEVAILLSQKEILKKINVNYQLIDYNDKASFDCILYDVSTRSNIFCELEPTLIEFLDHKIKDGIHLVIVWTLGKWRQGAGKKGKGGFFKIRQHDNNKKGHYSLLELASQNSVKSRYDYNVIVLDEII